MRASSVASLRSSASIAPQILSMMTVLTNTSSPELQYSTNIKVGDSKRFGPSAYSKFI
jgi:hypothetical protein